MASCGDCHYSHRDDDMLTCRRYPPQVIWAGIDAEGVSPEVADDWWCGEHFPAKAAV